MYEKKQYKKVIFSLIFAIFFSLGIVKVNALEAQSCELSEEYIAWMNLSQEEKDKVITPSMCKVDEDVAFFNEIVINSNLKEDSYPKEYDILDKYNEVYHQGGTETCWAFSSMTSVASNLAINGIEADELSAYHIEYATASNFLDRTNPKHFDRQLNDGGSFLTAAGYFVSGMGPVKNSDFSVKNRVYNSLHLQPINYTDIDIPAYVDVNEVVYVDYLENCNDASPLIKEILMGASAVSVSIYYDISNEAYYNGDNYAYYYGGNNKPNHAVTIVGWDDNYSKEKFGTNKPSTDGAWKVLNSHGADFGDGGYFYVSYEDFNVCKYVGAVVDADLDFTDHIYENEHGNMNMSWGSGQDVSYAANVFTKESGKELLKEIKVGSFTLSEIEAYVIDGVDADFGNLDIDNAVKVAEGETIGGFVDLRLDEPLLLKEDKFAIIIKYITVVNGLDFPIGGATIYGKYQNIDSKLGLSFMSSNGHTFKDAYNLTMPKYDENGQVVKDSNDEVVRVPAKTVFAIKAFTDNANYTITSDKANLDEYKYDNENGGIITVDFTTSEIADDEELVVEIINSNDQVVTDLFRVAATPVENNKSTVTIAIPKKYNVNPGEYTLKVSYAHANVEMKFTVYVYQTFSLIEYNEEDVYYFPSELYVNEDYTLKYRVIATNFDDETPIRYSVQPSLDVTDNGNEAVIDNGSGILELNLETGKNQAGTYALTVTVGNIHKTVNIKIKPYTPLTLDFEKDVYVLNKGDQYNLVPIVNDDATNGKYDWSYENLNDIETIEFDNGFITAKNAGEATVTVTADEDENNKKTVTIKVIDTDINIVDADVKITSNASFSDDVLYDTLGGKIEFTVEKRDVTDVQYRVLNNKLQVVDNFGTFATDGNKVTLTYTNVKNGAYYIEAVGKYVDNGTTYIELSDTYQFVVEKYIPVSSIEVSDVNLVLDGNSNTYNLEYKVLPENATYKEIEFTPVYADVDFGKVSYISGIGNPVFEVDGNTITVKSGTVVWYPADSNHEAYSMAGYKVEAPTNLQTSQFEYATVYYIYEYKDGSKTLTDKKYFKNIKDGDRYFETWRKIDENVRSLQMIIEWIPGCVQNVKFVYEDAVTYQVASTSDPSIATRDNASLEMKPIHNYIIADANTLSITYDSPEMFNISIKSKDGSNISQSVNVKISEQDKVFVEDKDEINVLYSDDIDKNELEYKVAIKGEVNVRDYIKFYDSSNVETDKIEIINVEANQDVPEGYTGATIRVKAVSGIPDDTYTMKVSIGTGANEFTVTKEIVANAYTPLNSITFDKDSYIVKKGDEVQLTPTLNSGANSSQITWKSSDESVLTVDENGKVTTVGNGSAYVTATSKDKPVQGVISYIAGLRGGTPIIDGNRVTYNEGTVEFYPADPGAGRDQDGWRIGLKIEAPEGMDQSVFDDAIITKVWYYKNGNTWQAPDIRFGDYKDGVDYLESWIGLGERFSKVEMKIKWTASNVQTITIILGENLEYATSVPSGNEVETVYNDPTFTIIPQNFETYVDFEVVEPSISLRESSIKYESNAPFKDEGDFSSILYEMLGGTTSVIYSYGYLTDVDVNVFNEYGEEVTGFATSTNMGRISVSYDETVPAGSYYFIAKGKYEKDGTVITVDSERINFVISEFIPITEIEKEDVSIYVNETGLLSYLVKPNNATYDKITIVNQNEDIITLADDGTITPLKAGNATIKLSVNDGSGLADVIVNVEVKNLDPVVELIPVYPYDLFDIYNSKEYDYQLWLTLENVPDNVVPTFKIKNANNQDVSFDGFEYTPYVDAGKLVMTIPKGFTAGQYTLVATVDNEVREYDFEILNYIPLDLGFNDTYVLLLEDREYQFYFDVSDSTSGRAIWTTSDPLIAAVDDYGTVTSLQAGEVTITIKADGFPEDSTEITFVIVDTKVDIDLDSVDILTGQRFDNDKLYAGFDGKIELDVEVSSVNQDIVVIKDAEDNDATGFNIQKTTSDGITHLVITYNDTVPAGDYKLVFDGSYVYNNIKYDFDIDEYQFSILEYVPVESIEYNDIVLTLGEERELTYLVEPEIASYKDLRFEMEDNDYVSLEGNVLKANAIGDAELVITSLDNPTITKTIKVYVVEGNIFKDSGYTESNGYVFNVNIGTTVDAFISRLNTSANSIVKLYDINGVEKNGGVIATGDRLYYRNSVSEVNYTIVIRGDVSPDGRISALDYIDVRKHIMGDRLQGVYALAADVNNDGAINALDYIEIRIIIMGGNR